MQGNGLLRSNASLKHFNCEQYARNNHRNNYQQEEDFNAQLENLTGQDLANRHHLLWRPSHMRVNTEENPRTDSLAFVGPTYSRNHNVYLSREAYNYPQQPRIATINNSETAAISNYYGGRFSSPLDSSSPWNTSESSDLHMSDSANSFSRVNSSPANSIALRSNGM